MSDSSEHDLTCDIAELPTVAAKVTPDDSPAQIGRYRVERLLGRGGFGVVYLAHDDQLRRLVAIKIPHRERVTRPSDIQSYLTEARLVASLDHPAIVPVYDVGTTQETPCFVVSKYIRGSDLYAKLRKERLPWQQAATLVVTIADALHYAHKNGLVHRDVKPSNILLDEAGRPYVVDFGLALRDGDHSDQGRYCGTPAYMSPEQARGEGHRVDGRSDIFSIGIVLYELLSGRQPFRGPTHSDLLQQVTSHDAKPLRQYDETIPSELDRICQKAMAKRAIDRYPSAHDMAEDLRLCLENQRDDGRRPDGTVVQSPTRHSHSHPLAQPASVLFASESASHSEQPPATTVTGPPRVIPKGLRAFDWDDADFFPSLLPGPRDRTGLPEVLRFWKRRLEEQSPDRAFPVGLIYGPSGCGKSSLLRAGILPRLASSVLPVVVEATQHDTEARVLASIRRRLPQLREDKSLKAAVAELRREQRNLNSRKILIVIDQFEQWLHAHKDNLDTELVHALRQCDGTRVQCLLMVRDDFWLSVSRFLHALEINLIEGTNSCLADLFDPSHARTVLALFGRALGSLPEAPHALSSEQEDFLTNAVQALTEDGKVVCVRLAIFSEMMKGRAWSLKSLKELGGLDGVGVAFLEETFSSKAAPPEHRYHQRAARAVLRALLPDSGGTIRGNVKSREELRRVSGYETQPFDFETLLRILDSDVRLITPTDPEGFDHESEHPSREPGMSESFYQLTHDYLVPSLREWLTRKQRETRRGRAELLLAERAHAWGSSKENRLLPTPSEWLRIRAFVPRAGISSKQLEMMARTDRYYLRWSSVILIAMCVAGAASLFTWRSIESSRRELIAEKAREQETTRVAGLLNALMSASPTELAGIISELPENDEVSSTLRAYLQDTPHTPDEKRRQLHAKLALASQDVSMVSELLQDVCLAPLTYVIPIRTQLATHAEMSKPTLEGVLHSDANGSQRFRAGLALAGLYESPSDAKMNAADWRFLAEQIVSSNPEFQPILRDGFRQYRASLLPELQRIFESRTASPLSRLGAANAIADFARDDLALLVDLTSVATPEQAEVLIPIIAQFENDDVVQRLMSISSAPPFAGADPIERSAHAEKRAYATITVMRLGMTDKAMATYLHANEAEFVTFFAFGCRSRGVTAAQLAACLLMLHPQNSPKPSELALYGLLLALGEFAIDEVPESDRDKLFVTLQQMFAEDASPAIHSTSGWLLRHWGYSEHVASIEAIPVPYEQGRRWFRSIIDIRSAGEGVERRQFTFVVFEPGRYAIGSPVDEPGRSTVGSRETRHIVEISRRFAVLDREISIEEFIAFAPQFQRLKREYAVHEDVAAFGINWFDAVAFCRWISECSGLAESDQAYVDPVALKAQDLEDGIAPGTTGALLNWPLNVSQRGYRLPTEAEWEVAVRAGSESPYSFGSDTGFLDRFAWFRGNAEGRVHPLRQLRPSQAGLFDIHGNVFEWTHDWFDDYDERERIDPLGPSQGSFRVFRGGRWDGDAENCRASRRGTSVPTVRSSAAGFRLCVTLP